jgi:metal-responsive CopG/Arc/MetJ family transcriptional regulator
MAAALRKITITISDELVAFADQQAAAANTSRSQLISQLLAEAKTHTESTLAAAGYQFYAQEAVDFAASSASAVGESWQNN